MKARIKLYICIVIGALQILTAQAQLFHPKDSVRKTRIVQFGIGGYYGINHIEPITPNFRYYTNDGFDKGVILSLRFNLIKHFTIDANYRYTQQTCMIGMQNDVFYESFHLTGNSFNIPLILRYNIFKNQQHMLTLLTGVGYQKTNYSTSNSAYELFPGYGITARRGDEFIDGTKFEYLNYVFGISKEIYLTNNLHFSIFTEVSIFNNPIVKENFVRSFNQNIFNSYFTEFKQWNSRIGIMFIL